MTPRFRNLISVFLVSIAMWFVIIRVGAGVYDQLATPNTDPTLTASLH